MATGSARSTRFAVDGMLGSLARKLRALGFDSTYHKDVADSRLIALCREERRALLTADRQLAASARARGVRAILVNGRTDGGRLSNIAKTAPVEGIRLRRGEPRCSLCNGELRRIARDDVKGLAPESVISRHRLFQRCSRCGHVYWRGGHWKKLRRLGKLFEAGS